MTPLIVLPLLPAASHAAQDSVVVASPLPGGAATIVRFLFHVPQWIQIGGVILGVLAAAALLVLIWRRREAILVWLTTRSRGVKLAMASAVALIVLAGAGTGAASWNYMQHDNSFCTGCHVMAPAVERFTASEHDSLSCHDCHQQSLFASARQLYLWVLERPEEIGPHAPVPNRVCETCHVTGEPEVWQRIASTAGHRTHLESDSSALRDVMCVTCHGVEVHRFAPVDQTCAQADCHVDSEITLGAMANQTALHCVTCHAFTAEVPALATWDSAAGTLVPGMQQCFSCHEMQAVLADFDPVFDPHRGTCGMCHNPHEDVAARDADATCASAACHVDWRAYPFHTGARHVDVATQCTLCHEPHRARVDASDCTGCHAAVAERPGIPRALRERLRRLAPFDTTRVLRQGFDLQWPPRPALRPHAIRDSPMAAPADTFSHKQHERLACLVCHTTREGHGRLTFEPPRGCQICHHQAPETSDCASCHAPDELATPATGHVRVAVHDAPVRERPADFLHDAHAPVACVTCHTAPVTLAVAPAVARCSDCHTDHHTAARECAACHASEHVHDSHAPPADAHVACDACHAGETVRGLLPDRAFCLTCHETERQHYAERECTVCHMLATHAEFQPLLSMRDGAP